MKAKAICDVCGYEFEVEIDDDSSIGSANCGNGCEGDLVGFYEVIDSEGMSKFVELNEVIQQGKTDPRAKRFSVEFQGHRVYPTPNPCSLGWKLYLAYYSQGYEGPAMLHFEESYPLPAKYSDAIVGKDNIVRVNGQCVGNLRKMDRWVIFCEDDNEERAKKDVWADGCPDVENWHYSTSEF